MTIDTTIIHFFYKKIKVEIKITRQKYTFLIFILGILLLFSQGCNKKEKIEEVPLESQIILEEWPVIIGETAINQKPVNVLSLSPALTEISFELGFFEQLAGRSNYCDYPKEALNLRAAGNINILDMDVIYKIKPDFIILQSDLLEDDQKLLKNMGIVIVKFEKGNTLEEVGALYKDIFLFYSGNILGEEDGNRYINNYKNNIEEIKESIKNLEGKKNTLYLNGVVNMAATPDTFEGSLLSLLDLNNLATGSDWDYSFENIQDNPPDIIILSSGSSIDQLFTKEILEKLPAYEKNKIIRINGYPIERRSPRMLLEIKGMALSIYETKEGS